MKKKDILLLLSALFVFFFKIFSYQMQEKYIVSGGLNILPHENNNKGLRSDVALIKDSDQFIAQVVNNPKPVIIKIFSNTTENTPMKTVYQSLANKIGDVVFFASINTDLSHQLKTMLQNILGFDEKQLPLIIFFKEGQMILPAFSGRVSEQNLFKLVRSRFGQKLVKVDKPSSEKIKNKEEQSEIFIENESLKLKKQKENQDNEKKESVWKKLKNAFSAS